MGFVSELKRRNVLRMAALYAAAAWLVMEVSGVIIDLAELPGGIGRLILTLLAIGFPIALVLSWFYEITPEGITLEDAAGGEETTNRFAGRRLDFVIISLLTAAVLLFAYHTWWPATTTNHSVAVLPFDNMSGDPDREYFSDGMAEELLNALSQEPGLRVISRSSSFSFKGKDADVPTVARALNATHVVEGSVRVDGNRLRITAQLIDAANDSHLWSATYDDELGDIFRVQQETSSAIAAALREALGLATTAKPGAVSTSNGEAYDAFLRGRYLIEQRTLDAKRGALREFEKAIKLDPGFARAHAELAMALVLSAQHRDDAMQHADRSLALEPDLAAGHAAKGLLARNAREYDEAAAHFRRAIELDPNYAIVHTWLASVENSLGNYDAAFAAVSVARDLDPLSVTTTSNLAMNLIGRGRFDEARKAIADLESMSPHLYATTKAELDAVGGHWSRLLSGSLEAWRLEPDSPGLAAAVIDGFVMLGLDAEAIGVAEDFGAGTLFAAHWSLGMWEEALADAEAYYESSKGSPVAGGFIGILLAANERYEEAAPYLDDFWIDLCGRKVTLRRCYTPGIASIVATRRALGKDAREIIAAIHDHARRLRSAGLTINLYDSSADFDEGLALYFDQNREGGLRLMQKAATEGYFVPLGHPYLQEIYDNDGFDPIREIHESRQDSERTRFLAIVCEDNPYAAVWQPREETCALR